MGVVTRNGQAEQPLSSSAREGAWKLGLIISCIAAPLIILSLYKIWKHRHLKDEKKQPSSSNGVRNINPAEFMQVCAERDRRLAAEKDAKLVRSSQLNVVAPSRPYSSMQRSSVRKPPPTHSIGNFSRWKSWSRGTKRRPEGLLAAQPNDACDQCSICLGSFREDEEIRKTLCDHVFHGACLERWLTRYRGRCPLCQMDFGVLKEEQR